MCELWIWVGTVEETEVVLCSAGGSSQAALDSTWPSHRSRTHGCRATLPADLGFLYHLTRSKQSPPLALFGWYFLLAFVFATIPAGIYGEEAGRWAGSEHL